jgi:hypothetical protein
MAPTAAKARMGVPNKGCPAIGGTTTCTVMWVDWGA